eukprot:CAMPEP_0175951756 /NCGR_PEP_ID=MMETSP0108-20121206/30374_1 /TAXON_ID=195067 ORGANISM="Goniomonas pacifica, Strain CCMP1869" /NCGR_SAMPLE_ID=MMETSP0108 /ASSEMBLY_ACC=CAM_ASM_000204 /LENGTH=220 /DNA_ID=CAMNT_0017278045 /DNA_START=95 /DNA_END=759 /DNA_ORIENTATION=-
MSHGPQRIRAPSKHTLAYVRDGQQQQKQQGMEPHSAAIPPKQARLRPHESSWVACAAGTVRSSAALDQTSARSAATAPPDDDVQTHVDPSCQEVDSNTRECGSQPMLQVAVGVTLNGSARHGSGGGGANSPEHWLGAICGILAHAELQEGLGAPELRANHAGVSYGHGNTRGIEQVQAVSQLRSKDALVQFGGGVSVPFVERATFTKEVEAEGCLELGDA